MTGAQDLLGGEDIDRRSCVCHALFPFRDRGDGFIHQLLDAQIPKARDVGRRMPAMIQGAATNA